MEQLNNCLALIVNSMKNVVIYTTPTCGFCKMTKEFFKENNVTYTEHDVAVDSEKAQEMVEKSGQMGVPVVIITDSEKAGDEGEIVVGFDKEKLSSVLGL